MSGEVPSAVRTIGTLARLTLVRLTRGKLLWVTLLIAFLPTLFTAAMNGIKGVNHADELVDATFVIELFMLAVIPPLFVAPSIGEEIEDRTATYLWSRPLARWTILAGKLVALAPLATAIVVASWVAAISLGVKQAPSLDTTLALGCAALAISVISAGIATVVPKHGMALSIIYVLILDLPIGALPASIRMVSVTHGATAIAGMTSETGPVTGAIAVAVIMALWLAVAFRRIARLET